MRASQEERARLPEVPNKELFDVSIVVNDFDSEKNANVEEQVIISPSTESTTNVSTAKPYSRQSSDASIRKIMEEAECRKNEFWKLIEEHKEVVEKVKQMEMQNKNAKPIIQKMQPLQV